VALLLCALQRPFLNRAAVSMFVYESSRAVPDAKYCQHMCACDSFRACSPGTHKTKLAESHSRGNAQPPTAPWASNAEHVQLCLRVRGLWKQRSVFGGGECSLRGQGSSCRSAVVQVLVCIRVHMCYAVHAHAHTHVYYTWYVLGTQ
jgi:hypothetical protein